ncbi:tRNA synthetases class I (R) [Gracilibacillus ureilyticus]|uniref:arginine--tRNA ligase n=1 Tax=Gracilibacillus ureilyticus TaxID=531814 RepID=A0A1H9TV13_9BACI|nr:tRNA synthetases class I (R) [Gracilibacillus ureilyticus]
MFNVIEKMGYNWHDSLIHVPFGMILKDGKKMSKEKEKVVLLEEVLQDAIKIANKSITEKNPTLANKEEVAIEVGTGAVIFHDLKNYRLNDIEFSLKDMLKFEGETGPYVQYTHARAASILRKSNYQLNEEVPFKDDQAWPIITVLMEFSDAIKRAIDGNDPSEFAKYSLTLAKAFNKYYGTVRILDDNEQKRARLALVFSVKTILKEALRLLGIKAPLEM